jgi:LmbE family N-acetylglucosaminyl deacetylase
MSVLVVAAHPDDEVLGAGGTVRALRNQGREVRTVILGEGVTSRYDKRADADQKLLAELGERARAANAVLGVDALTLCGFPDNRFDSVDLLDIVKVIEDQIEQHRPRTILTHHFGDLNIDHQITHRAVLTATRPVAGHPVRNVLAFEVPSSTEWAFGTPAPFSPNVFMDITASLESKVAALACYESEVREFPHPRSPEALRVIARRWASVVGGAAVEPFMLVRALELAL